MGRMTAGFGRSESSLSTCHPLRHAQGRLYGTCSHFIGHTRHLRAGLSDAVATRLARLSKSHLIYVKDRHAFISSRVPIR